MFNTGEERTEEWYHSSQKIQIYKYDPKGTNEGVIC